MAYFEYDESFKTFKFSWRAPGRNPYLHVSDNKYRSRDEKVSRVEKLRFHGERGEHIFLHRRIDWPTLKRTRSESFYTSDSCRSTWLTLSRAKPETADVDVSPVKKTRPIDVADVRDGRLVPSGYSEVIRTSPADIAERLDYCSPSRVSRRRTYLFFTRRLDPDRLLWRDGMRKHDFVIIRYEFHCFPSLLQNGRLLEVAK